MLIRKRLPLRHLGLVLALLNFTCLEPGQTVIRIPGGIQIPLHRIQLFLQTLLQGEHRIGIHTILFLQVSEVVGTGISGGARRDGHFLNLFEVGLQLLGRLIGLKRRRILLQRLQFPAVLRVIVSVRRVLIGRLRIFPRLPRSFSGAVFDRLGRLGSGGFRV